MTYLLDTHVLMWAMYKEERLDHNSRRIIRDPAVGLVFSAVSIWEVVIKSAKGRHDFPYEARKLRSDLIDNHYRELDVRSEHALAVETLPMHHTDPFDRLLVAQAKVEDLRFLTNDHELAQYEDLAELFDSVD